MDTAKLHYNKCRCHGTGCDRKADCLRFVALDDMGPGTPWTDRYCDMGRESEGFIRVREDVEQ